MTTTGQQDTAGGLVCALTTFVMWGGTPLYFRALGAVPPTEVLAHRIIWSILLLTAVLAVGSLGWVAQILGFVTTSTRAFRQQLTLLIAVCGTTAIASFAAVPQIGLYGAVLALGIAGLVGIGGQLLILRRTS